MFEEYSWMEKYRKIKDNMKFVSCPLFYSIVERILYFFDYIIKHKFKYNFLAAYIENNLNEFNYKRNNKNNEFIVYYKGKLYKKCDIVWFNQFNCLMP